MKTFYEDPKMEVIAFECEDIITTSGIGDKLESEDKEDFGAIH